MILLDGDSLKLADVIKVARGYEEIGLSDAGREKIIASRKIVDKILAEERPVYGISTGFGDFSTISISKDEREKFIAEHEMNSITGQKVNNLNSQLDAIQSFKQAKEKYGTLKPLDELMVKYKIDLNKIKK